MVKLKIAKNEVTPVIAFLGYLGGYDDQVAALKSGETELEFYQLDFLFFKQEYLAEGTIGSIREKLEAVVIDESPI